MARKLLAAAALLLILAAVAVVLVARGVVGNDLLREALERQLTTALGEPVRIASVGASFFPRVSVELHDVTAGEPVAARLGEVSVVTGLRGLLSRRVEDASVIVSDGRLPVRMLLGIAGAAASPPSAAKAPADSGLTIASVGTLAFRDVVIVAEPHDIKVDLESSLAGDRLEVSRLHAESAGTVIDATGVLTSIARREGQFEARANRLDLDELMAVASGLAGTVRPADTSAPAPESRAAAGPLNLRIELTSPSGTIGGYPFSDFSTTIALTPSRITMQPLAAAGFGGTFDGQLGVNLGGAAPALDLRGTLAGVNVTRALTELRGSASLSGTLGGTLAMASAGASADALLRAAHGTATLAITDGAIPGLEMVRAIVLAFGKPSGAPPEGSGSAFTRLGGTFALQNQTIRTQDLSFASRDYDMTGTAAVALTSGAVDAKMHVALSRELTAQAGTDLKRFTVENGRIILPATISGTLSAPKVSIDVAAALNRALQNELKRQVGGWLDRVIRQE